MNVPVPDDEAERLASLARYRVLETPPEAAFDHLTELAATLAGAPFAFVNLISADRQWSKSCFGINLADIPREHSVCSYAILQDSPLIVHDLREDPRFAAMPYISGPPHLRAFAGVPITVESTRRIGTICVYDLVTRPDFTLVRLPFLKNLAAVATDLFDIRLRALDASETQQRLELLQAAAEQTLDVVMITEAEPLDPPGPRIVYVNSRFSANTGYPVEEVIGNSPRFLQGPETDRRELERVRAALEKHQPVRTELLNYRKDGSKFWVELSIVPLRNAEGRVTHFVSVQRDVSERKILDQRLHQTEKLEAVRRLAGGVAHNFNNLLTVIGGYGQILMETLPPAAPEHKYVEEISSAADRASRITAQLLAFSRHGVVAPKSQDLNATVVELEPTLRRILGPGVELRMTLRPGVGRVQAGPGQLEQALVNLVENARDAMPAGGVLTIETNRVEIDDDFSRRHPGARPGPHVLLTVADTGLGMDEETRRHLFEPYFTTKGVGKGTGLPVVYGIVQQWGGDISIYSEPGGGTVVGIYLPAQSEVQPVAPVVTALEGARETIFLVEDEPEVRRTVEEMLTREGYRVLSTGDPREALRWTETRYTEPLDLLLTDVVMPGMSGPELADRMRASRPGLKVLFISGYSDELIDRGAGPGAVFLQKPFSMEDLFAKLRALLA